MTYRELILPAHPGQHRARSYLYEVLPNPDEHWRPVFEAYWANQARLYGLEFEDELVIDYDVEARIVTCRATVARVLDGPRTSDWRLHG